MLNFNIFNNHPDLKYGLSEKKHGDMGALSIMEPESKLKEKFEQNRKKFFKSENVDGVIFYPHLVHNNNVVIISKENYEEKIEADGFITNQSGIILTITMADCFPIYLFDPVKKVVGLAHAGWKGVVGNITGNIINSFINSFNSNPRDILMAIGPGIQKDHFVVRNDIIDKFQPYQQYIEEKGEGEYLIDLPGILIQQAQEAGIVKIESRGLCTHCLKDTYFSFRRDKPVAPEVMIACIGMKN